MHAVYRYKASRIVHISVLIICCNYVSVYAGPIGVSHQLRPEAAQNNKQRQLIESRLTGKPGKPTALELIPDFFKIDMADALPHYSLSGAGAVHVTRRARAVMLDAHSDSLVVPLIPGHITAEYARLNLIKQKVLQSIQQNLISLLRTTEMPPALKTRITEMPFALEGLTAGEQEAYLQGIVHDSLSASSSAAADILRMTEAIRLVYTHALLIHNTLDQLSADYEPNKRVAIHHTDSLHMFLALSVHAAAAYKHTGHDAKHQAAEFVHAALDVPSAMSYLCLFDDIDHPAEAEQRLLDVAAAKEYDYYKQAFAQIEGEYHGYVTQNKYLLAQNQAKQAWFTNRNLSLLSELKSIIPYYISQLSDENSGLTADEKHNAGRILQEMEQSAAYADFMASEKALPVILHNAVPEAIRHNARAILRLISRNNKVLLELKSSCEKLQEALQASEMLVAVLASFTYDRNLSVTISSIKDRNAPVEVILQAISAPIEAARDVMVQSDPYIANGMSDIISIIDAIRHRVLHLKQADQAVPTATQNKSFNEPVIVCTDRLLDPNLFYRLIKEYNVAGFVFTKGATNQHWALLARGMGIPVMLVEHAELSKHGLSSLADLRILGDDAVITVDENNNPLFKLRLQPEDRLIAQRKQHEEALRLRFYSYILDTQDGVQHPAGIAFYINSAGSHEIHDMTPGVAAGVGLARTELFLDEHILLIQEYADQLNMQDGTKLEGEKIVSRERLFHHILREIKDSLSALPGLQSIFTMRTWDVKPDKNARLFAVLPEQWAKEGFTFYTDTPIGKELLALQVEAALNAAFDRYKETGIMPNIRIMFPMVSTRAQIEWLDNTILQPAKERAWDRICQRYGWGVPSPDDDARYRLLYNAMVYGSMVETAQFIQHANEIVSMQRLVFFSVGTNDLTTALFTEASPSDLAHIIHIAREDEHFQALYAELKPMVLNAVVELAREIQHWNNAHPDRVKTLGICGDIASTEKFVLFALWMRATFGIPVYVSVPKDDVAALKVFSYFVESPDWSIFDNIDHAVDTKATEAVSLVRGRMQQSPAYKRLVTEPLGAAYPELSSAESAPVVSAKTQNHKIHVATLSAA
jgi:phosphoenolpyruvate-protein kinase (PTS system EI component)